MQASIRSFPHGLAAVLWAAILACGGGTTEPAQPPPPPPPPPPAPVATVTIQPQALTLVPQQAQQLTATLQDALGNALSGRTITWTISAPTVASVSGSGLVTAVAPGTAMVTATSESRSASATLTVLAGSLVGPSGGTVIFDSGAVSITVPPGAVTTSTVLTVSRVTSPTVSTPNGWQRVGPVYAVGPAGVSFAQPVTVTVAYDLEDLPAFTMTGDIGVLQWSNGAGQAMTNVVVDTGTARISARTNGFGSSSAVFRASSGTSASPALLTSETEIAVVVQDPQVSLTPSPAKVNSSHRHATLTVAVAPRGGPVPLPQGTPALLYRWRSSNQHGGLGIGTPGPSQWTETATVEYVATNPQLAQMSGEIDRVWVDVLLNPTSLTDPLAGPQRIVTAEAIVDADLEVTYDITPQSVTVKQAETTDLQLRARNKQGGTITLGPDFSMMWETSGNHGQLTGDLTGKTVTYEADDEFAFPPPRVDRVVVVVKQLRRQENAIRARSELPDPITGERHTLLETVDLETNSVVGRDTAFVTVQVEYEVTLAASDDTVAFGGTITLQATLDPMETGVRYRFTSAQTQGTLTPASGTTIQAATAQYRASNWASGGPETIKVEVLDQSLQVLGEAEVTIEVDPWRAGSFTVITQDVNCVVPYITIPKVTGATNYEVIADRFNHPTVSSPYTRSFSGPTGGTAVFSVQDAGTSWRIRMEGGGCAISDSARDAMRAAMFSRFAGIRVRYKVTGGP